MGFFPGFSLGDGEVVLFAFGGLLVAAGFITAGYFVACKRNDANEASRD